MALPLVALICCVAPWVRKNADEMAKQRMLFMQGAVEKGFTKELASNIFDLMEKFAGYGFNKSHSAAYALVAYQTAWLKQHYPAEFMAATISSDMDKTDKVVTFIDECRAMGLDFCRRMSIRVSSTLVSMAEQCDLRPWCHQRAG